jgi:hypothetical protein
LTPSGDWRQTIPYRAASTTACSSAAKCLPSLLFRRLGSFRRFAKFAGAPLRASHFADWRCARAHVLLMLLAHRVPPRPESSSARISTVSHCPRPPHPKSGTIAVKSLVHNGFSVPLAMDIGAALGHCCDLPGNIVLPDSYRLHRPRIGDGGPTRRIGKLITGLGLHRGGQGQRDSGTTGWKSLVLLNCCCPGNCPNALDLSRLSGSCVFSSIRKRSASTPESPPNECRRRARRCQRASMRNLGECAFMAYLL